MNVEIQGHCEVLPQEKRCYLPGIVLYSTCPGCGKKYARDLGDEYLSYGDTNLMWECDAEADGCWSRWETKLRARITLESDGAPDTDQLVDQGQ